MENANPSEALAVSSAGRAPQSPAAASTSLKPLIWVALGFLPALACLAVEVWPRPVCRWFPFGVAAALGLLWLGGRRLTGEVQPGAPRLTLAALGAGLLGLAVATVLGPLAWAGLAALVAVVGVVNSLGGSRWVRAGGTAWLVWLVVLPMPPAWEASWLEPLQAALINLSRPLLGELGVLHVLRTGGIEIQSGLVPVPDACAGLFLMPAALGLALGLTTLLSRPLWQALVVTLTMPVWTCLAALIWLVVGLRQLSVGGLNFFTGVGAIVFGGCCLLGLTFLAWSMDQFLCFLTVDRRTKLMREPLSPGVPCRAGALGLAGWWPGGIALLLGLSQVVLAGRSLMALPDELAHPPTATSSAKLALPTELAGWAQMKDAGPARGEAVIPRSGAQVSYFAQGDLVATVALESGLPGFMDLLAAYRQAGWRAVAGAEAAGSASSGGVGLQSPSLQNEVFQYGRLWFAVGNPGGSWLPPSNRAAEPLARVCRVQVFVSSLEPMNPAQVAAGHALFKAVVESLGQPAAPLELPSNAQPSRQ